MTVRDAANDISSTVADEERAARGRGGGGGGGGGGGEDADEKDGGSGEDEDEDDDDDENWGPDDMWEGTRARVLAPHRSHARCCCCLRLRAALLCGVASVSSPLRFNP